MRAGTGKGVLCSMLAWLLLLLLLHTRGTHAHGGHIDNDYSEALFESYWIIYEMDEDVWYADFFMRAKLTESNAWVAIGFKEKDSKGSTTDFDLVVGYDGNITDRWAKGIDQFAFDTDLGGTNDVVKPSAAYKDGYIQANFTRKLHTGDKFDFDLDGPMPFVLFWAYGIRYSDNNYTVKDSRDIPNFNFWPEDNVFYKMKAHGILMVFVLMILMTSGIILSRYMKTVFYWWFYVHAAIFVFSLVFIIISCVLIFQAHNNAFEAGWHSIFGLFFIIAMGSQSLLGLLSHLQFDKKRLAPPIFPDKIHWWLGRASFFIGIVAILLGFDALPARRLAWNSFWVFLIGIFFLVLTLEKYVGQTHEAVAKGIAEDDEAFDTRDDDDLLYVPKKGNSLSIKQPTKQLSMRGMLKILVPASFGIGLLFILVAVGINTTDE